MRRRVRVSASQCRRAIETPDGDLPGWIGSLLIIAVVWYWDSNHQTISRWHWSHPWLTALIFTYLWSHMVLKKPQRILIVR